MDYASDIDSEGVPLRRQRRGGVSFLIIATGSVCLAAAWILAASDPYSHLAQRVLEVRAEGGPIDAAEVPLFELAAEPEAAADPVAETLALAPGQPLPEFLPATVPAEAEAVVAAAPVEVAPTVGPHVMPDERPVIPPDQFVGPRLPVGPDGEAALALSQAERRAVQRRLKLAGHDAGPADGVFGDRTREAIAAYQRRAGFRDSGFLNAGVLSLLNEETEVAYHEWRVAEAERHRIRRASRARVDVSPTPEPRERVAEQTGGCRRSGDGAVIGHQSVACDIRGLGESIGRLFSGELPKGNSTASLQPRAGANR